ncbi:hypothetical protein [uncultured Pseudoalteromonas sp.]
MIIDDIDRLTGEEVTSKELHQGKMCCGRTALETLLDGKSIWAEKNLAQI